MADKPTLEERVEYLEALLGASALVKLGEHEQDVRPMWPQPDPEGFVVLNVDTWGGKHKSVKLVQRELNPDQYDNLVKMTREWNWRDEKSRRPPTWFLRGIDRGHFPVHMLVLIDEDYDVYAL